MTYLTIYQELLSPFQMIRPFFSIVQNVNTSASHLNGHLSKIINWAFQWNMRFNADPSKQAQEVIFSCKIQKICHLSIYFNNKSVKQVSLAIAGVIRGLSREKLIKNYFWNP